MSSASISDRITAAKKSLEDAGQTHVLDHIDTLDDAQKDQLLTQIEKIDWPEVARLVKSHVEQKPGFALPEQIEPAPYYPMEPGDSLREKYAHAQSVGEELIKSGKVAAFCVAGGQGSRLGYDGPKGCYPATPIRELPLFAVFCEYLHYIEKTYGKPVPFYIMTSPVNDALTRAFFEENDYFGLSKDNVMFFPQAMLPAFDMQTGKALLAAPDSLALSPNGHGGSLKALHTSGATADMKQRGIEQISYVQVDNPMVRVVDPLFIGLHALDGAQMSSKMLQKRDALEKVGNFCVADGKVTVIEYSNLPDELARQTVERDGQEQLKFNAGSIAIHVISRDFVESINTANDGFALPWNRAEKKVAYWDPRKDELIEPDAPNAVKLETFVFDALPMCDESIVLETLREDEFAPIKNADTPAGEPPATDSPESSKKLQSDRAKRWLKANGVTAAADAVVEVPQSLAVGPDDLKGVDLPASIGSGQRVLIEG